MFLLGSILLDCIQNVEKQITQTFENAIKLKEKQQIKDECQMQNLNDTVDFFQKVRQTLAWSKEKPKND